MISIARSGVSNPKILILDEAPSSIDTCTESLIIEMMKELMANRTTFGIAHRLSTIEDVDKIILLDKGEINELGSNNELLKNKGEYCKLNTQA